MTGEFRLAFGHEDLRANAELRVSDEGLETGSRGVGEVLL